MNRLISLRNAVAATILTTGLAGFGVSAEAGHYCGRPVYVPQCRYQTIIDYEFRPIEYTECITQYTPCGHPYQVHVTRTKLVQIPVERVVKVCY